jgi:hypothetical protein
LGRGVLYIEEGKGRGGGSGGVGNGPNFGDCSKREGSMISARYRIPMLDSDEVVKVLRVSLPSLVL